MREVAPERTGWRDHELSQRHREWGFNCPAVDLDFVMAEYNHGKPVALIEYKHYSAKEPNLLHPTYRALADLADNYAPHPLPFMVVFYWPGDWYFRVLPVNEAAQAHYKHVLGQCLSEQRFVTSLYLLRKNVLDEEDREVISRLNNLTSKG